MFDYLIEKIKKSNYNQSTQELVDLYSISDFFKPEHYNRLKNEIDTFKQYAQKDNPEDGPEPTVISLNDVVPSTVDGEFFYDELLTFFKEVNCIQAVFGKIGFTEEQARNLSMVVEPRVTFHTDYPQQSDNKHTDQKNNLFAVTLQIYLPDDDSIEEYGTQFYNSNNEEVYKTKFLPNSGYLMISNNNAWHKSVNGVYRKSLLVRYNISFDLFTAIPFGHHDCDDGKFPIVFNRNKSNDTCSLIWNKDMQVFEKITDWFANMTFHNCIDLGFENLSVVNAPYKWDLYTLRVLKNTYGFKKAFIFFGGFEWKNKEVYEYAVNLDMKDKVIAGLLDEDQFLRQCVIINLDKLDSIKIEDAHGDGGFFERFIGQHIDIEDMWLPRKYYHPEVKEEVIVRKCLSNSNEIDNFPKLEYIKKHQTKTTLQQYQKASQNFSYAPYGDQFAYLDKHFDNPILIHETQGTTKAFKLNNFFSKQDYLRMARDVIVAKPWTNQDAPIEGTEPSIITFDTFKNHEMFYKRLWQYFSTSFVKRKILTAFGHDGELTQILKCLIQSMSFHTEYPHQIDNSHSDQKFTLSTYTLQIYLPEDDSIQNYGTEFVDNNDVVLYHNKFLPNQGYFMESNNNSWHRPVMGVERKSLVVRYTIEMDFAKTKRVFNWDRTNKLCHIVYNRSFDKVHTKITDWFAIASMQNALELGIKNVIATTELDNTLEWLKKLGYNRVVIYNGGHIFTDNNTQQYAVPIGDVDKQNAGFITGDNVNYYTPNKADAPDLLYFLQHKQNNSPELETKLEHIKGYRDNHTSLIELSKSISPYTFIRCSTCDNDNALVVDLPSQYGFRCTECEQTIWKKVESYLDFTDYIEKDFYDLS